MIILIIAVTAIFTAVLTYCADDKGRVDIEHEQKPKKEGEEMKPCAYCKGRKVEYHCDGNYKMTVKCSKCGAEVKTPYSTYDNAAGYWNMKMTAVEKARKEAEAAAV